MDIEYLKQAYFELDNPVPFLNFLIKPISVKDYYTFYWAVECLTLEKNKDPNGIVLSHLGYLLKKIEDDSSFAARLSTILELIFGIENGSYCSDCGFFRTIEQVGNAFNMLSAISQEGKSSAEYGEEFKEVYNKEIAFCPNCENLMKDVIEWGADKNKHAFIRVRDSIITKESFEEFKQIVCHQNMPDYNDDYIDPALEEELKEVERLRNKNIAFPSLEKQMCCVIAGSAYTFETLKNLSLRKFVLLLRTIDAKLHYQIYKMNENSGAVTFKTGLDHWIYETKKSRFDNIVSLDSIKDKLKHVAK